MLLLNKFIFSQTHILFPMTTKNDIRKIQKSLSTLNQTNFIENLSKIESILEKDSITSDHVLVPNEPNFQLPNDFLQVEVDSKTERLFLNNPSRNINYVEYNENIDKLIDIVDEWAGDYEIDDELIDDDEILERMIRSRYYGEK